MCRKRLLAISLMAVVALAAWGFSAIGNADATEIQRGGTLRVSTRVMRVDHPARYSWIAPSNIMRQVLEYLTITDEYNITHPYLLESWEASDDLMTWTLYLRRGITFNNGDPFTADDVVFSMREWLDPEVGSSTLGLMHYLDPDNITKVDDYKVELQLDSPQIAVPEHLYHYPNQILNHRTFEGDILAAPHGTGPFKLVEYVPGERAVLERRDDYWQIGEDGEPLPYLDEIVYLDLGEEASAHIAAFAGGEVDRIDMEMVVLAIDIWLGLRDHPRASVQSITTANTVVLRMRVDRPPWDDELVRQALKLCQDREKILDLAFYGEGSLGQDHHVSSVHPAYAEIDTPEYDPERARELLEAAGYPDGIDVTLSVATGWPDAMAYAEVLQADALEAGIRITLETMPVAAYWDIWTETDLGITPWTQRPLGTIVLRLGYTCDADGNPVAWNETRWCDPEFQALLSEAEATVDVDARRDLMREIQLIQQERGSIGIAFWKDLWSIADSRFENIRPHPTAYDHFQDVWYNPEG